MKNHFFKDKVALITGSTLGIGKSLAYQLARSGARVILNGRNNERLSELEQAMRFEGLDVTGITADVTSNEDCKLLIQKTIETYKRIDFLILMAGLSMKGNIVELKPEVFRHVMETNYLGSVYPVINCLPYLIESKGSVIFASSVAGMIGLPGLSAYCASKMSLTAFAESLKTEFSNQIKTGIIYISFTENEPEKRIMAPNGMLMKKMELDTVMKYNTRERVVNMITNQLKSGKFICNYLLYGKAIRFFKFFLPCFILKVITAANKKLPKPGVDLKTVGYENQFSNLNLLFHYKNETTIGT